MNKCYYSILITFFCVSSFAQNDSTSIKKQFIKSLIAPTILVGAGYYSRFDVPFAKNYFNTIRNNNYPNFHTSIDDYIQFLPVGAAYGLGIFPNLNSKNNFINKSVLLAKSEVLMSVVVLSLKYSLKDKRPDSGAENAWPSGHTAQAFVAASFLDHEYRDKSVWISVAGYTCATTVGVLRVLNNRHWSADVLAGAGIGILSTNLVYLTHQFKWKNPSFLNKKGVSLLPYYYDKTVGGFISFNIN